jgi:hypothetical protein
MGTEIVRPGDYTWYYADQRWGMLTTYFRGGRVRAVRVDFIPSLPSENSTLERFGFPTGQRATSTAASRKDWSNLGGYSVRLLLDAQGGRSTGTVNGILIWQS